MPIRVVCTHLPGTPVAKAKINILSLVFKTLQWVFIILMQDKHKTPSSGSFLCLGYISSRAISAATLILFILTNQEFPKYSMTFYAWLPWTGFLCLEYYFSLYCF